MVIERDSAGHPLRLLATLADVHDKREALERQRMSASLFQHLHEGLLITDPDLRALDVNPAYTHILGVPRDELIGTVPSLLRPTPDDPVAREQRAAMWASLRDQGHWRGELLERRRNGEACMLHATISTVPGPTGRRGTAGADARRYHVLVISDITEQQSARDQLERQAHFDELTGLPNRAHLSTLLDEAMRAADRDGYLLTVCYLDLDHFKPVNDEHGHAAGDRLLAELAGRLRAALRGRPNWTDAAARLGGDEFVLLLRAGTLDEARLAVERVLRVVSLPYTVDDRRRAGAGHREHGRHRLPHRPQRRRHPAAPRRPRDVRRQAGRPQRLSVLRPRTAPPHRTACGGHRPHPGSAGPTGTGAALPAQGRHEERPRAGLRGAAALGTSAEQGSSRRCSFCR